MEFFNKASAVSLNSHLDKYLIADDDQTTVRQSRNGLSKNARWTVEFVQGNPDVIRLKSCHGGYLMASDEPLMLGLTGKKVVQSDPGAEKDGLTEWEPIREGFRFKLRTKAGKFLRANGATPPWRNSITHDIPQTTATQDWIMWDVYVVDSAPADLYLPSNSSSFSSMTESSVTDSPSSQSAERKRDSAEAAEKHGSSIVPDRSSHGSEREVQVPPRQVEVPPRQVDNRVSYGDLFNRIISITLVVLAVWFLVTKVLPVIWSWTILAIMLAIKIANRFLSDSAEEWMLKILSHVVQQFISTLFGRRRVWNHLERP